MIVIKYKRNDAMYKNLSVWIKNHKNDLFPYGISIYLYILYTRFIYVAYEDIIRIRTDDFYQYTQNHWLWYFKNENVRLEIFGTIFLLFTFILSFYLLYKKHRYFYAVMLLPIYLGLFVMVFSAVYNRFF